MRLLSSVCFIKRMWSHVFPMKGKRSTPIFFSPHLALYLLLIHPSFQSLSPSSIPPALCLRQLPCSDAKAWNWQNIKQSADQGKINTKVCFCLGSHLFSSEVLFLCYFVPPDCMFFFCQWQYSSGLFVVSSTKHDFYHHVT